MTKRHDVYVRELLLPRRRTWPSVLAAILCWSGLVIFVASLFFVVLLFVLPSGSDHGMGATLAFGLMFAGVAVAGAGVGVRWVETRRRWARILGAAVLAFVAWCFSFYPLSWLRDPYSFPLVGAIVGAVLTVVLVGAAVSLLRSSR